jgi:hypothetical protein
LCVAADGARIQRGEARFRHSRLGRRQLTNFPGRICIFWLLHRELFTRTVEPNIESRLLYI